MCPPDPIVVTVDIVSSPSPLIGSAIIGSVASTSEAIQLITSGAKGVTGSTGDRGATGSTGNMPSNYVISINGITGTIENVAKTNIAQTFTGTQFFPNGISADALTANTAYFDGNINATKSVILNTNAANTLTVNGVSTFNQGISISKGSQLTGANIVGSVDITGGDIFINGVRFGVGPTGGKGTSGESNLAIGLNTLNKVQPQVSSTTRGIENTAIGTYASSSVTSGSYNVAVGSYALRNDVSLGYNTAIGARALLANTTGVGNCALGVFTLQACTVGNDNVGNGSGALQRTVNGSLNTSIGNQSYYYLTSGNNNVAIGYGAGAYLSDTVTTMTKTDNSVHIGYNVRGLTQNQTNEIAIGYLVSGNGSNTVTLGNTSITRTFLRGTVDVAGGISATGASITGGMTASGNINFIGSVFLNPPAASPFPSNSTGKTGQITWGLSGSTYYLYLCVDTNTWKNLPMNSY